jgi:hypothetical protein
MAYLKKSDYTLRTSVVHLDEICDQAAESSSLTADQVREKAETWAMALVKGYIGTKYDMVAEYAKDGEAGTDTRNPILVQVLIDLALCTLHKGINPRDVPDHIAQACVDVKQWLEDARTPTFSLDLPVLAVPVVQQHTFLDSQPKFISKEFQDPIILGNE